MRVAFDQATLPLGDAPRRLPVPGAVVLRLRMTPAERERYDAHVSAFCTVYRRFRALMPEGTWRDFLAMASRWSDGRAAVWAFRMSRRITSLTQAKRTAIAALLQRHHGRRILVFTQDNDAAYAIAREHLVMPITCDIGRSERDEALAAFRTGELRVLVSARALSEGIGVPDADVAIVAGGTAGEREHVRRVGGCAAVYELVMMRTHETRQSFERRRGLAPSVHAVV
jgi:superfamily II DNA or RNA helicase